MLLATWCFAVDSAWVYLYISMLTFISYYWFSWQAPRFGWLRLLADGQFQFKDNRLNSGWQRESRWCWLGFHLVWIEENKKHQCWIFIDALTDADARTLARHIQVNRQRNS